MSVDIGAKRVITKIMLLAEKFLNCNRLNGALFQLNLKYQHVEIAVSIVTHKKTNRVE